MNFSAEERAAIRNAATNSDEAMFGTEDATEVEQEAESLYYDPNQLQTGTTAQFGLPLELCAALEMSPFDSHDGGTMYRSQEPGLKRVLYPWQVTAVATALARAVGYIPIHSNATAAAKQAAETLKSLAVGGQMIGDQTSLGKTVILLTIYHLSKYRIMHRENTAKKYKFTVLVVPSAVIKQWTDEITECFPQLGPFAFGDAKQNPFQKLVTTATITRVQATGGNVSQLQASARFHNAALFDLCALVNAMPHMTPAPGAFDNNLSERYAMVNKHIWGIESNLIFINTKTVTIMRDTNRSTYCRETAAVAIKDAVERMRFIEGRNHVIINPYNAQVMMLRRQRDHAVSLAHADHKDALAQNLQDVEIVTIDSFMDKDRNSVTVDTAGVIGHLFEYGRTVVATTRACTSCQFIGPTCKYTAPNARIQQSHPLAVAIRQIDRLRHIKTV